MISTESELHDRSTASLRTVLRGSPHFARLNDREVDAVLARSRIAKYRTGDRIVTKGDPGESMMAILGGRISISVPSPEGRQVVLSVLRSGDIFGEIALLDGKERTADATALTRCEILIIPRRSLWVLLERRLDLCIDLMLVLCDRLRHTNQQVEDLAFLDLEARMAKVLLRLLAEGDWHKEGLSIKISQRALGELVGGSRESVNKILNVWKEAGAISLEKGAIIIRDMAALVEYTR
jgi:CRP/FNR family transcriptional regulator, cyclic AMP receptor protein